MSDPIYLEAEVATPPCAGCGGASIGRIWLGVEVCGDCYGDWQKRAPTEGAIDAKYGHDASMTEQTQSYELFTHHWLDKRKAELKP